MVGRGSHCVLCCLGLFTLSSESLHPFCISGPEALGTCCGTMLSGSTAGALLRKGPSVGLVNYGGPWI